MLALTNNNVITKYPIGLVDLQQSFPNTSFVLPLAAVDLVEFGVVEVHPTDQPAFDAHTQRLEEATPSLTDGEWRQQWSVIALTAEEQKQLVDGQAATVRAERDRRLTACDWTQLPDATVDHAAWAAYRKALRDLPIQAGFPWTVTWPAEPNA